MVSSPLNIGLASLLFLWFTHLNNYVEWQGDKVQPYLFDPVVSRP
jgi:hypothetical protein